MVVRRRNHSMQHNASFNDPSHIHQYKLILPTEALSLLIYLYEALITTPCTTTSPTEINRLPLWLLMCTLIYDGPNSDLGHEETNIASGSILVLNWLWWCYHETNGPNCHQLHQLTPLKSVGFHGCNRGQNMGPAFWQNTEVSACQSLWRPGWQSLWPWITPWNGVWRQTAQSAHC